MVVGPKELEKKIEEIEKNAMAQLERQVDQYLEQNYQGEEILVPGRIFEGVRSLTMSKLLRGYHFAGWLVRREDDQREGSYYVFTPKPEDYDDGAYQ